MHVMEADSYFMPIKDTNLTSLNLPQRSTSVILIFGVYGLKGNTCASKIWFRNSEMVVVLFLQLMYSRFDI